MDTVDMLVSGEFLLTSLVVVLIPGTGVIYTVSVGLLAGWRPSLFAALGSTLGIVPHLLAGALGLLTVLHLSALAFTVMKYLGAAYLCYLAWSMWRDQGMLQMNDTGVSGNFSAIVWRGLLINILNPKLSMFFLAFLPQFITAGSSSPMLQMLVLSAIFMAMTFVVFVIYGYFANSVRGWIVNSPRLIRRVQQGCAGLFVALATRLALADR